MMKKMKGFTLAEVLTTLMVIGVVAAITIPMLMNSTDEQEHKAQYKKAMSVLSQGVSLMTAKEVTCKAGDTLAGCFLDNVVKGTLVNNSGVANSYAGTVIMGQDGSAYAFRYAEGDTISSKKSLKSLCGKLSDVKYDGSDAKCFVSIDLDGFSKNSDSFSATRTISGNFYNGTDKQVIIIAGDGVRPLYINGNNDANMGFKWMYGEDTVPTTDTDTNTNTNTDTDTDYYYY